MREILFRGKSKAQGSEWLYGDVLIYENSAQIWETINNRKHNSVVSLETIGQYTGLTDKNGKRIFEGDIIHREYTLTHGERKTTREEQIGVVVFKKGEFRANVVKGKGNCFGIGVVWKGDYIEVIGNIHDNPELLKGGAEQ